MASPASKIAIPSSKYIAFNHVSQNSSNSDVCNSSFPGIELLVLESRRSDNVVVRSAFGDVKNTQDFSKLEKSILDWGYPESCLFYIGGMKCMITFLSKEIASDFVKEGRWKDHFDSMEVWNGDDLELGRIVKLRMEGMPMVLRDEAIFRRIAELFGRAMDDVIFSWDAIDISTGYCLVLSEIRSKIEEEVTLVWKNKSYSVWVSEVSESWSPEFGANLPGKVVDESDDVLEDGEFRPPHDSVAGGDASREEETTRFMDMGGVPQDVQGSKTAAHVCESTHAELEVLGSPCGPYPRTDFPRDDSILPVPNSVMGRSAAINSKKRPRIFRSPEVRDYDLGSGYFSLPFPDLNCVVPETCPRDFISPPVDHLVGHSPMEVSRDSSNGEIGGHRVEQNPGDFGNGDNYASRETEDTIHVGVGIRIQLDGFEDQVRSLIEGEGVQIVSQ
ncbi:hypothetical protein L1987_16290 [Smallanthus sonchifolius]|uniref:Uncharacterized protein n=1 Tax=Smallanthus sonchifolius TaxID=185202 RepID=A0ACB9JA75_9ASTR|nr:hypothetical protein L1987_16290 [Smallanthus sonchifolius]